MRADWPEGVARHVLEQTDSTNAEAMRRLPDLSGPAWILSRVQTAGRGRRGRAWVAPVGNFTASYATRWTRGAEAAAQVSFVAALALDRALSSVVEPARLALKWPNDVLLDGGKLAGILLESSGAASDMGLVVGIGINLIAAPPADQLEDGARPAVALDGSVTPEGFLDRLAPNFDEVMTQFCTYGFAPIRAAWLARAAHLGQSIVARTGRDTRRGVFEGIDERGALLLREDGMLYSIDAADIYFSGAIFNGEAQ